MFFLAKFGTGIICFSPLHYQVLTEHSTLYLTSPFSTLVMSSWMSRLEIFNALLTRTSNSVLVGFTHCELYRRENTGLSC